MQAIILSSLYTFTPLIPTVAIVPCFTDEGLRKGWLRKLSKATQLTTRGAGVQVCLTHIAVYHDVLSLNIYAPIINTHRGYLYIFKSILFDKICVFP